jgi:hypothetical protein
MNRQDRADAVDREMTAPAARGGRAGAGLLVEGERAGLRGRHAGRPHGPLHPSRRAQITPWPSALGCASGGGDAVISRAEVASAVADALRREAFREALVAIYVWGKSKRGPPGGSLRRGAPSLPTGPP